MAGPSRARVKELFLQAIELAAEDQERLVASVLREDAALGAALQGLLAAHTGAAAADLERMPSAAQSVLAGRADRAHADADGAERTRAPGQRLGDYELIAEVGSGASGSVWRALQVSLDRVVALKVLRAGRFAGAKELERLRAEAEAVARLDHPHIVPVHEVGEHEGHAFFSMKWIEGGTLADRLEHPWPPHRAARLVVDLARAVHHAHQRGLLHRDLKPSNVLLDAEGRAHVADFGIAKRLEEGAGTVTTHALAGTPAYMAPEQVEGGELTVATDVWALGAILYELLAARPAFGGGSVTDILRKVRGAKPTPLRDLRPDVPRDLETIALACLEKEPGRRYPSADALANDLERWLAHEPIAARRTGAFGRIALFCRRSPLAATLIGLVLGLVLLLAAVATGASVVLSSRLRDSYLGEARATRLSGAVGARTAALELLARAAAIRPGDDLRDEAIACLALTDLALERSVERPPGLVAHVVPDPALERLAVGDEHGLRILRFDDASELVRLSDAPDVGYLRWSPRGRWLLSKHHDPRGDFTKGGARVWDTTARAERWSRADAISFGSVDFTPDESRLAYGTAARELVVVELDTARELLRIDAGGLPSSLRFSPDGAYLGVAIRRNETRFELRDAATLAVLSETPLPAGPYDLCWTDGGRSVALACDDFRVYVIDTTGASAAEPRVVCRGHSAEATEVFACASTPLFTSHSWDETTRLWDAGTGREIRRMSARALGFSPDGRRLALTDGRSWSLWRVQHGDFLRVLRAHSGKSPVSLAFAPDGRGLATAGPDGVYLWDGRSGSQPELIFAHEARAVRFLPDGRALLATGGDGLWRLELEPRGEPRRVFDGPLWRMALSADGRTLAVHDMDTVYVFDPADPADARKLSGGSEMEYLTLSADGTRVAAGNWRGLGVHLWDLCTGDAPRVFLPEQTNVAAALSPDGELLATASAERFELWRAASGERLFELERRRAFGNAPAPIAFSPDGSLVAFALSNEIVRLIDAHTFEMRGTLEPPELSSIFELAFSPDGSVLGSACSTNRVQLWSLAEIWRELEALGLAGTED